MTHSYQLAQIDFSQIYNNIGKLPGGAGPLTLPDSGTKGIGIPFVNATLGNIVTTLLPYIFIVAGLILLGVLIQGGFELLTSSGEPEKVKGAQGKITNALIGFLIIFMAYWIGQILETVVGIKIF